MSRFCTLCSSSSGNSAYIGYSAGGILIDAGTNTKQLCLAMQRMNIEPESIRAIFITHEHADHISALRVFASRYKVPVYATEGTLKALINMNCITAKVNADIIPADGIDISGMIVKSFKTSHDSAQSCGYTVQMPDERKISVATDTGYITDETRAAVTGSDLVLLESNHDVQMLKSGPYPYYLKQRILSDRGHLSNADCAAFAEELINTGTTRLVLGHLSKENNIPAVAYETTNNELGAMGAVEGKDYQLYVAPPSGSQQMFLL